MVQRNNNYLWQMFSRDKIKSYESVNPMTNSVTKLFARILLYGKQII